MSNVVALPLQYYPDPSIGRPVFNGKIYIGEPDTDPEILANRKSVTLKQEDGSLVVIAPEAQPLVTSSGGLVTYNGGYPQVLVDSGQYAIKILNKNDVQVMYVADVAPLYDPVNEIKTYTSVASLRDSTGNDAFNVIEVESYYEITYPSTEGPKGGHKRHRTGGTNTSPTVGSPVAVSTIGTGTQAGYVWDGDGVEWEITVDQQVTVYAFGAITGDSNNNASAIEDAFTYMEGTGNKIITPDGGFGVHRQLEITSDFLKAEWLGYWYAMTGFTDDYLVNIESGGQAGAYTPQFYHPSFLMTPWLKCNFLCRGMRTYNVDHLTYYSPRVENPLGRAFLFDRLREAVVFMPQGINGAHREAYSDGSLAGDWDNSTTWAVDDVVRYRPAAYNAGTTYATGDVVLSGGENWISAKNSNIGNVPGNTSTYWRKVPHQDYKCLIQHSGQDPLTQNTNNSITGNHYWQKVYQDEALIEFVDEVYVTGDRQNQVTVYSPICRDSDNKCLVRIDNNRNTGYNTHINIYSGHIHQIQTEAIGDYPEITGQEDVRCLEIGRAQNVYIHGANLFTADRPQGISVLIGDLGSKTPSGLKLDTTISSGGDNQSGIIFMPSVVGSERNKVDVTYSDNSTSNYVGIVDYDGIARVYEKSERILDIPQGRSGTPIGHTVRGAFDSSLTRYYGGRKDGDSTERFRIETTAAGTSRLGFGDGSNTPDTYLERKGANRLGTGDGDQFEIDGTWDAPFVLGGVYIWANGNDVRIKATPPTSATDGALWVTAT